MASSLDNPLCVANAAALLMLRIPPHCSSSPHPQTLHAGVAHALAMAVARESNCSPMQQHRLQQRRPLMVAQPMAHASKSGGLW
jgi:hypothetical protein